MLLCRYVYVLGFLLGVLVLGAGCADDHEWSNSVDAAVYSPENIVIEGSVAGGGTGYTNESTLVLRLNSHYKEQMLLSMEACPDPVRSTAWEGMAKQKTIAVEPGFRNKPLSVYVRYRTRSFAKSDAAKNEGVEQCAKGWSCSKCFKDDITHDDLPPRFEFTNMPQGDFFNKPDIKFQFRLAGCATKADCQSECSLNGGYYKACAGEVSYGSLDERLHSFNFKAVDKAGNYTRQSFKKTLDTTAPTLVLQALPQKMSKQKATVLKLRVSEHLSGIGAVECSLNGVKRPCEAQELVSLKLPFLKEGPQNFVVKARDGAGNWSKELAYSWVVDTLPPSWQSLDGPRGPVKSLEPLVFEARDTGSGLGGYLCEMARGAKLLRKRAICKAPYALGGLQDGHYVFKVWARDKAGNTTKVRTRTWTLDTIPPRVRIDVARSVAARTNKSEARVYFGVSDTGAGVSHAQCRLAGGKWNKCQSPFSVRGVDEGRHVVEVRALDLAGNWGSVQDHSWRVDMSGPVVRVDVAKSVKEFTREGRAEVWFSLEDLKSGKQADSKLSAYCRVGQKGAWRSCESPFVLEGVKEGKHWVFIKGTDELGNESAIKSHQWVVDRTPPQLQLSFLGGDEYFQGDQVRILLDAKDGASGLGADVVCHFWPHGQKENAQKVPCALGELSVPAGPLGAHGFSVRVEDALGNAATSNMRWFVDIRTRLARQFLSVASRELDILFVVDGSGSMKRWQEQLAGRVDNMLSALADLDVRVGVTTMDIDGKSAGSRGTLLPVVGAGADAVYHVDALQMGLERAQALLAKTILSVGTKSGTYEVGIGAVSRFLGHVGSGRAHEAAFFRKSAHFAVVAISDANSFIVRGNLDTPGALRRIMLRDWPQKNFVFNAFIADKVVFRCEGEEDGRNYATLARLTNGVVAPICAENYAPYMGRIASRAIDLHKSFFLECDPVETRKGLKFDIIRQESGGKRAPYKAEFEIDGGEVLFEDLLPPGQYELQYRCEA